MNYSMINNDIGAPGIFRARLIPPTIDDFVRAYIPGISNVNPFTSDGDVNESIVEQNIENFPTVQWCCYNIESAQVINQDPVVWVMFESGDFKRPVVISYAVIGGAGDGSGGTASGGGTGIYNPGGESGVAGVGTEVIIPEGYGTFETYEKETGIGGNTSDKYHGWAKGSAQRDLRVKAIDSGRMTQGNIFGLENCAIIDNRLLIATKQNVGGNFPLAIGDYVDVCFSDGTVWNCIIGDFKGSDAPNPWGHNNGQGVVEIIYWDYSHNSGNQYKKVDKLIKVGKYE